MAVSDSLVGFANRLRAILDDVNAELIAKGAGGVETYSDIPLQIHKIQTGTTYETQEKRATPSRETQEIVPDSGKLLSKVTIEAIDAALVDTSDATAQAKHILAPQTAYVNGEKVEGTIVSRTLSDVTANGQVVTIPSGHYASLVSKSVKTGTLATPSLTIDPKTGKISATGKVSSQGFVYSSTTSPEATLSLPTQAEVTITPTSSTQIAVESGKYTTGEVRVGAIPSDYVKPTVTQAGGTITLSPGKSKIYQSGTYLTSALNISAAKSSVRFGDFVSGSSNKNPSFEFDTTNMCGFYIRCNAYASTYHDEFHVVAGICTGSEFHGMTIDSEGAVGYKSLAIGSDIEITFNSTSVLIQLNNGYYFYVTPKLLPIYVQ